MPFADNIARQGAQGKLDRASNAVLENEFGTKATADVVARILEQGDVKETKVAFLSFALRKWLSLT